MNKSKQIISLLKVIKNSSRTIKTLNQPAMGEAPKNDNNLLNETDKWFNR